MPVFSACVLILGFIAAVYFLQPRAGSAAGPIFRRVAASSPVALWLSALVFYSYFVLQPDAYAIRNGLVTSPAKDLVLVLALSALESVFMAGVARFGPRRNVHRSLLQLLAFLPWAVFWLLSAMHAAPVFTAHALWQIFVVAGLLISIGTCIIRKR